MNIINFTSQKIIWLLKKFKSTKTIQKAIKWGRFEAKYSNRTFTTVGLSIVTFTYIFLSVAIKSQTFLEKNVGKLEHCF